MNDGRLGAVRKLEDVHRKFMCVMNDVAKYREDELKQIIDKESKYQIKRKDRSAGRFRQEAVHRYALGKCLELNRESTITSPTGNMFGHYNGRPIKSFSTDVENYIAGKDRKVKKRKEMENLMKKYKNSGKILEEDQIKDKVQEYLHTRWGVHYKSMEKDKEDEESENVQPQIRVVRSDRLPHIFSFYKSNMQTRLKGRAAGRRASRIEIRDESGHFVPLESLNAIRGRRKSIFPPIDKLKSRSTIKGSKEVTQPPSQSLRRKSILPTIT